MKQVELKECHIKVTSDGTIFSKLGLCHNDGTIFDGRSLFLEDTNSLGTNEIFIQRTSVRLSIALNARSYQVN